MSLEIVTIGNATLYRADCMDVLPTLQECAAIVTDPPYELGFMGNGWDKSGIANSVEMWAEALRVLKPGGHLLAFSGSRTYHRMTCAIEDAGFDIRDQIMWLYGSGMPKSLDVSKAIDKAAGAERKVIQQGERSAARPLVEDQSGGKAYRLAGDASVTAPATDAARQWQGWGTALKPAHEPICVARKPLVGTVAANVLEHGTGALNIDGCRVESGGITESSARAGRGGGFKAHNKEGRKYGDGFGGVIAEAHHLGRWPANLIHDGSDDVVAQFPETKSGGCPPEGGQRSQLSTYGKPTARGEQKFTSSEGSAARFFYCAKASKRDRGEGNNHPTVKPTDLMRYLCRLVTPPGGLVLDPFMGSGSTGKAAVLEGFQFIGIEREVKYFDIACERIYNAYRQNTLFGQDENVQEVPASQAAIEFQQE